MVITDALLPLLKWPFYRPVYPSSGTSTAVLFYVNLSNGMSLNEIWYDPSGHAGGRHFRVYLLVKAQGQAFGLVREVSSLTTK